MVQIIASDGGTRNQTFLAKRTEAITGFSNDSYIGFSDTTGGSVRQFTYAFRPRSAGGLAPAAARP